MVKPSVPSLGSLFFFQRRLTRKAEPAALLPSSPWGSVSLASPLPVGHPGQGPLYSRLGDTRGQGKLESGLMGVTILSTPN